MANWCGGIRLDKNTLKLIDGVICDVNATTVDRSKAVSTCGQLWDGALFTVAKIGGAGYITLHGSDGEEVGTPVAGRGNCGVGLDGRFFKIVKGTVVLQDGFILTVNVTPEDADFEIVVMFDDIDEISPIAGTANQYLLNQLGESYSVAIVQDGDTKQQESFTNDGDKTLTFNLS